MKKALCLIVLCALMFLSACSLETVGAAHLQVSNRGTYRVQCLVEDGTGVFTFWVEAGADHSVLLDLGEYRVKVELYRADRGVAGRYYTLSLTEVGRVHQIAVDDTWVTGEGGL
jgi:hypothetical protein